MISLFKASIKFGLVLFVPILLAACNGMATPENTEPVSQGMGYQAQYRSPAFDAQVARSSIRLNAEKCRALRNDGMSLTKFSPAALNRETLTPGDLVDVRVEDDVTFSGQYVVSQDGTLKLPFLDPVVAEGRSVREVELSLIRTLLNESFFDYRPRVSVRLQDMASIAVAISGAVFNPRRVNLGRKADEEIDVIRQQALGDANDRRNLSLAIKAAGGIRPDADLSSVELHRSGSIHKIDLRDMAKGVYPTEIVLQNGDQIVVHSRGCFQDELMHPGPLSPQGVKLFLSNLIVPTQGNAPAAVDRDMRTVEYGTRFTQAVIGANCVGGIRATSANRSAILATRNPVTGNSTVIQRNIEQMLQQADRDEFDPYLLPGDAIACYDSTVTNVADVARVLGIVSIVDLALN